MNMVAVSLAFREPPWVRRERIKSRKGVEGTQRLSLSTPQADNRTKVFGFQSVLRNTCAVLKCAMIYVLVITWLVFSYNYDIFLSTIVDFAMEKGVSLEDSVSFITYTSVTDLVGRVMLPILTDRGFLERSTLMTLDYFLLGLCAVSLAFLRLLLGIADGLSRCCSIFGMCYYHAKRSNGPVFGTRETCHGLYSPWRLLRASILREGPFCG
ncbi:hypothetical protein MTO96_036043 [Rhipicephalus appendiculatus]